MKICPTSGKESFATRPEAERALARMNRGRRQRGSVYYCEVCKGFHVTHLSYSHGKNKRTKMKKKALLADGTMVGQYNGTMGQSGSPLSHKKGKKRDNGTKQI